MINRVFIFPTALATFVEFPFIGDSFIADPPALRGSASRRSSDSWVDIAFFGTSELESYCNPLLAESIYIETPSLVSSDLVSSVSSDLRDLCIHHLGESAGSLTANLISSNVRKGSMAEKQKREIARVTNLLTSLATCLHCQSHPRYQQVFSAAQFIIGIRTTLKFLYAANIHPLEADEASLKVGELQRIVEQLIEIVQGGLGDADALLRELEPSLLSTAALNISRYLMQID